MLLGYRASEEQHGPGPLEGASGFTQDAKGKFEKPAPGPRETGLVWQTPVVE